ncbi:hypothetical protein OZ410_06810 [Robiginitalea sp. M366]|uniref:hypothetical protein n=1 Tax=Robiginitalea aestuariiviva TaxID=3036903 RepID=UPI00240E7150|nr:hypothetical protein [Robiginitalea aestuariiviva]MDG1572020.1 hypothetical protein [Robiginitalea aestuariiviva]
MKIPISANVLREAENQSGKVRVRLATDSGHGIAVYGRQFGRYPTDPSLVIELK